MKISEINDEVKKLEEKIQELKVAFKCAITDKSIDLKIRWDFFCESPEFLSVVVDDGRIPICLAECFSRPIENLIHSPEGKQLWYTVDLLDYSTGDYVISETEYKEAVLANNLRAFWL
jgi:hypothetical protein